MSQPVYRTLAILYTLVISLPLGTDLALLHVLWALVSGQLLAQRGALVPALAALGLGNAAVLRAWRAFAHGRWSCDRLIAAFQKQVVADGVWRPHRHGATPTHAGYAPVACDLTAFFRPALRDCRTRHYSASAKRMMAALPFGLLVRVGSVLSAGNSAGNSAGSRQRIPVPIAIVRADPAQSEETALMRQLLTMAAALLKSDEVLVADRGFGVAMVQQQGVERFVVRCARNAVAYRQTPPAYSGRGRKPKWGALVRPLVGRRKGETLAATPPDGCEEWQEAHGTVRAEVWEGLTVKGAPQGAAGVRMVAIADPRYREPLLLATTLPASVTPREVRNLYLDRWPVEVVPQSAKQMLGAHRQFVFGKDARWRLPELCLLAACVALYVAATLPAVPTGFWDRTPRPTAGRLRRLLAGMPFPSDAPLLANMSKKQSVTAHLPKGIAAHRRLPSGLKRPNQLHKRNAKPKVTRN